MDLLNFFQFLQALLAIFVVLCLCTKGPVKHHCHVALVVLVISMMIIPPFGHNFLSMKEGLTPPPSGPHGCMTNCMENCPTPATTNTCWPKCTKKCNKGRAPRHHS